MKVFTNQKQSFQESSLSFQEKYTKIKEKNLEKLNCIVNTPGLVSSIL